MLIDVRIHGTRPVLPNRLSERVLPKTASPAEHAELRVYRMSPSEQYPDGELFIPGDNLFQALIEAGRHHKLGKARMTTNANTMVPGLLDVLDRCLQLSTDEFSPQQLRHQDPNDANNTLVSWYPRVMKWHICFTLSFDEDMIHDNQVRELMDTAGEKIGICYGRASRRTKSGHPGYGTFMVTKWEVQK